MHYQICHFDLINKRFYDIPNSVSLSEPITDFLQSENYDVNSKNRIVQQLYMEGGIGKYKFKVTEAYTHDNPFQIAHKYNADDITHINLFFY